MVVLELEQALALALTKFQHQQKVETVQVEVVEAQGIAGHLKNPQ
jgi:hypothetical protein